MTLPYDKIFSKVFNKIDDPKELSLNENDLLEVYTERLHSIVGNSRVRRLFSSIILDDEIQELTFALNHSVDDYSDEDFVLEILALGMIIEWLQPQVDSRIYTSEAIGGKEEKVLQNNYKPMQTRLEKLESKLDKKIRDYGTMYNSYIKGD